MKKYLLLTGLLIILSGCAVGVYDGYGFHGVAIGPPYPYYEPYYPDGFYGGYYPGLCSNKLISKMKVPPAIVK